MRKSTIKKLEKLNPCSAAVDFAKEYKTSQEAWDACECGDWMLWLLGKLSGPPESKSRKKLVWVACKCARLSLRYVQKGERRPLKAIQTAEKYAKGQDGGITLDEVRAAATAADAAYAAVFAASAASAADAAAAARKKKLKKCADIVRKYYPKAPRLK